MRTTITLDPDVAEEIKAEMRRRGVSDFKQTVNDLLRRGLRAPRTPAVTKPFRVRARRMGERLGLNYDNTGELLEQLEASGHK
jgi:hypothetical protein